MSISQIDINIKNFLDKKVEKAKFIPQIVMLESQNFSYLVILFYLMKNNLKINYFKYTLSFHISITFFQN